MKVPRPCPFCKQNPEIHQSDELAKEYNMKDYWWVICYGDIDDHHVCRTFGETADEAIMRWNGSYDDQ